MRAVRESFYSWEVNVSNVWDALTREVRRLKRKVADMEEEHVDVIAALKDELNDLEARLAKESSKAKPKNDDD